MMHILSTKLENQVLLGGFLPCVQSTGFTRSALPFPIIVCHDCNQGKPWTGVCDENLKMGKLIEAISWAFSGNNITVKSLALHITSHTYIWVNCFTQAKYLIYASLIIIIVVVVLYLCYKYIHMHVTLVKNWY